MRCGEICLFRLSDELIAARTLAHIERPQPRPLGRPLPLGGAAAFMAEMFTKMSALLLMSVGACSTAIGSMSLYSQPFQGLNCVW